MRYKDPITNCCLCVPPFQSLCLTYSVCMNVFMRTKQVLKTEQGEDLVPAGVQRNLLHPRSFSFYSSQSEILLNLV